MGRLLRILLNTIHHRGPVPVFLRLIWVTAAPYFMAAGTSYFHSILRRAPGYHFQVVRPADHRVKINERCC